MARKLRLIKTSIYVKHDQFSTLNNVDFNNLQNALKQYISKRGDGKDCTSIVRVFPTLASSNTVDIELAAFREDIDLVNNIVVDGITNILDEFIDLDFTHFIVKQTRESMIISGILD